MFIVKKKKKRTKSQISTTAKSFYNSTTWQYDAQHFINVLLDIIYISNTPGQQIYTYILYHI